jgi:hypothetical protein
MASAAPLRLDSRLLAAPSSHEDDRPTDSPSNGPGSEVVRAEQRQRSMTWFPSSCVAAVPKVVVVVELRKRGSRRRVRNSCVCVCGRGRDETRNRDATVVKSKRKKKSLNKKKKWNGEKGDRREKGRTCLFMAVNKGQIYINIELLLVLLLRFGRSVSRILPPSTDRNFLSVRPIQYVFTFSLY